VTEGIPHSVIPLDMGGIQFRRMSSFPLFCRPPRGGRKIEMFLRDFRLDPVGPVLPRLFATFPRSQKTHGEVALAV